MISDNGDPTAANQPPPCEPGLETVSQNIESVLAFYSDEELKIGRWQRIVERISDFIGRLLFLASILVFVALWVLVNLLAPRLGWVVFDPPPFVLLGGIVALGALVVTVVVLIKQNRLAKLEEKRAHLDLQVNLLAEQKTTKLIQLIEELRRDLPMVHNRHDPEAEAMTQRTDPQQVLTVIGEKHDTDSQAAAQKKGRPEAKK